MRRRQEEGMADAPHTNPNPSSAHIEYVSGTHLRDMKRNNLKRVTKFLPYILIRKRRKKYFGSKSYCKWNFNFNILFDEAPCNQIRILL